MSEARAYVDAIRLEIEASSRTRLGKDSVNMLNTVSESVFSRSAHFILELLQNAEDAGPKTGEANGSIEFSISPQRIRVSHNGLPFTNTNVDAICGVRSSKKPEMGTLGFLGIGFKSVFKVTDNPQIFSGDFRFAFDRAAHNDPTTVPWQIMPLWLETVPENIDPATTTFILPFRSGDVFEQTRSELRRLDVHAFLFLKWLGRVSIVDEVDGTTTVIGNKGERDGILTVTKDSSTQHFFVCRRSAQLPAEVAGDPVLRFYKRENVTQREVVVAFALDDGRNLQAIPDASALGSVSSFLPLVEERSGARFLIQADFLVQPGREAIQYELSWNRWLVDQAVEAVKDAINVFKNRTPWCRQYLPLFSFATYPGQQAFEKLFGPRLRDPVMAHLRTSEVVPAQSGGYITPDKVVRPDDGLANLLRDEDLPLLFPYRSGLRLLDSAVSADELPEQIREDFIQLSFGDVARCNALFQSRLGADDWFQQLFGAMAALEGKEFRKTLRQGRKARFEWVEDPIFVLTDRGEVQRASGVYVRDIPQEVLQLREEHPEVDEVLNTYRFLHPCLGSDQLTEFFATRTHVERIDFDRICRNVFLPKVRTSAAKPSLEALMAYTRLLQKGPRVDEPIWVAVTHGGIEPSDQVFLSAAYAPSEDWQRHSSFAPHITFLSDSYVANAEQSAVQSWKEFFAGTRVRDKGENNHVEVFAMLFVEDALRHELSDFVPKNRQQGGYDREARRIRDGQLVKLEIKGQKKEQPVQLIGNEPQAAKAAQMNQEPFWLCVVAGVPESPQLWVIEDPVGAGRFDTLTIDVSQWKIHGRRARSS